MSWDRRFEKFGAVKVHLNIVKVYRDYYNYITIKTPDVVQSAVWLNHALNVTLANGKVIQYKDPSDNG
ncbi:MAG TPA: hypothetical protein VNZ45_13070 [Bacteroidia bacterium]|jgi:hypothetical protein|nr:hypothetical protein [Bacteroidia bacterium]